MTYILAFSETNEDSTFVLEYPHVKILVFQVQSMVTFFFNVGSQPMTYSVLLHSYAVRVGQ